MRLLTFCCFFLSFNCVQLFSQLNINYNVINSSSPESPPSDLIFLDSLLSSVKLVGMGESTHGTHEFFELKHRVFKYLVEELGFNTFFLEADYGNCLRVNRYIHGAEDSIQDVVMSIGLWPWQAQEMKELLEWMRDYNLMSKGSNLNFIGCDLQNLNTTVSELDRLIQKYDESSNFSSTYPLLLDDMAFVELIDIEEIKNLEILLNHRKDLESKLQFSAADKYEYLTLIRHLDQIIEEKENPKFYTYRDLKMGQNILYHLENDKNIKGFYWAHNFHISEYYKPRRKKKNSFYSAGGVLNHHLRNSYFSIGLDFSKGNFLAYHRNENAENDEESENFEIGDNFLDYNKKTLGFQFKDCVDSIVFFQPSENLNVKWTKYYINNIGAVFYPPRKQHHKTTMYLNDHVFDSFIVIQETSSSRLLTSK